MGTYRQPGRVVDTSLNQANQIIGAGINKFDALFEKRKQERALEAEKNAELLKEQQLLKAQGWEKWEKELRESRPEGGYNDENIRNSIDNWGEEYYSLIGRTDQEALKRMGQLMSLPKQIAEYKGAMGEVVKNYEAAQSFEQGAPGSIDPYNSSQLGLAYVQDAYNNGGRNLMPTEENGVLMVGLGDNKMNASNFVNGSINGQKLFNTNGDIGKSMDGVITGITAGIENFDKGMTVVGKRGKDGFVETTVDRTVSNEQYRDRLKNFDYTKTLGNQEYMTSIWPQVVNRAVKLAEGEGEEANRAKQLLYGADMEPGTKDDYIDVNGSIGPWVGSTNDYSESAKQREIAKLGFYEYGTQEQFLKPDKVMTGRKYEKYVRSGSSSSKGWVDNPKAVQQETLSYTQNIMDSLNDGNIDRFEHIKIDGKTYTDANISIDQTTRELTLTYNTGKTLKEVGFEGEVVDQSEIVDGKEVPKGETKTLKYDWNEDNLTTLVKQVVKGDPQWKSAESDAINKQVKTVVQYLLENRYEDKEIIEPGDIGKFQVKTTSGYKVNNDYNSEN